MEHKRTCLPHTPTLSVCPPGVSGQKAPSAVHLSPVSSTAKPCSQQGSLADTPNGVWEYQAGCAGWLAGWLEARPVAGCCCPALRLQGSAERVKPQAVSAARLDRPDTPEARGSESIRSQVTRGRRTSAIAKEGGGERMCSVPSNCDF